MAFRRPFTDNNEEIMEMPEILDGHSTEKIPANHERKSSVVEVQDLAEKLGDDVQVGLAPVDDIEHVIDKVDALTVDECRTILTKLLKDHEYDYNFATAQKTKLEKLLAGPDEFDSTENWELALKTETAVNKYYSPYPEVRAVTTPDDVSRKVAYCG
jgi:hypothetical protein